MSEHEDKGKRAAYGRCRERILALCEGEEDDIARMASVVAVLHGEMGDFYWTGFYRAVGEELVIGPYQGTVGCLRIGRGRGVCGTAAATGKTVVVRDVHEFPGHIACDARSQSEIVVPVWRAGGDFLGVLDVDATRVGAFDEVDGEELEGILGAVFGREKKLRSGERADKSGADE